MDLGEALARIRSKYKKEVQKGGCANRGTDRACGCIICLTDWIAFRVNNLESENEYLKKYKEKYQFAEARAQNLKKELISRMEKNGEL